MRTWTDKAEDLWGLRAEDVEGLPFSALDMGLPVRLLERHVDACLQGREDGEISLSGHDRRGKPVHHQVVCSPLRTADGEITGAIILMNPSDPPADGG